MTVRWCPACGEGVVPGMCRGKGAADCPMTCWGCSKHAETGLDGFVQADCTVCMERERIVTENHDKTHAIANGENARKRENPKYADLLTAEIRAAWPERGAFLKWRRAVWTLIQARERKERG